ncbi:MAG: hypothetical protein VKS61_14295 [Candidatus Sericytochromatia bacterium]|nr:hypothetical protein [Candidatus Sericytochromatia bacterium]
MAVRPTLPLSLMLLAALAASACAPPATVTRAAPRGPRPSTRPAAAEPAQPGVTPPSPRAVAALSGRVSLPPDLLSKTKPLIADQGAGVVSNGGAGVISNGGAGLAAGRGAYALRQAPATVPVPNAVVTLRDATGAVLRDGSGQPRQATTDREGRYAFLDVKDAPACVAVCELPSGAGQVSALVPRAVAEVDLDHVSTTLSAYVLARFARPQADPQAALERLPAALEARARRATGESLAAASPLASLDEAGLLARVDQLRGAQPAIEAVYEEVRRAMVVAGQSEQGTGALATEAAFTRLGATVTGPDGTTWLVDNFTRRLWRIAEGRLVAAAGQGQGSHGNGGAPKDGEVALDVNLPPLVALRVDREGRPLLLSEHRLDRLEASGTLNQLWRDDARTARGIAVLPEGGVLVNTNRGVMGVAGATVPPLPPPARDDGGAIQHLVVTPTGACWYTTHEPNRGWRWWGGTSTTPPVAHALPATLQPTSTKARDHRRWLGLDDAGWLVVLDATGALTLRAPDGQVRAYPAEVTGQWPETLRAEGREVFDADGEFRRYAMPYMVVSGSATGGHSVMGRKAIARLDAEGRATIVAGSETVSQARPAGEVPTALTRPRAAVATASGEVLVLDGSSREVLRVTNGLAGPFAGLAWNARPTVTASEPAPFGYALTWRSMAGAPVSFGQDYAAPALEARLVEPERLRLAPDGSIWVLDNRAFLRRIREGQVTTVAVAPGAGVGKACGHPWVDAWPTGTETGMVLVLRPDGLHLRTLAQAATGPSLAVFPRQAAGPAEDAEDAPEDEAAAADDAPLAWTAPHHAWDGMAPLPGDGWLVRAYGVTWRWQPGSEPVRLSEAQAPADASSETNGGQLTGDGRGHVAFVARRNVYRVAPTTGSYTPVAGQGTSLLAGDGVDDGLSWVKGASIDARGDLLVVDFGARQVKRLPAAAWQGGTP